MLYFYWAVLIGARLLPSLANVFKEYNPVPKFPPCDRGPSSARHVLLYWIFLNVHLLHHSLCSLLEYYKALPLHSNVISMISL